MNIRLDIPQTSQYGKFPEFEQNETLQNIDGGDLLKTIKVPANLANLSSRLPKSNYEKTRAVNNSLSNMKRRENLTKTS